MRCKVRLIQGHPYDERQETTFGQKEARNCLFPSHATTLILSTVAVDDNMLFNVKWSVILAKTWGNYLGQDATI